MICNNLETGPLPGTLRTPATVDSELSPIICALYTEIGPCCLQGYGYIEGVKIHLGLIDLSPATHRVTLLFFSDQSSMTSAKYVIWIFCISSDMCHSRTSLVFHAFSFQFLSTISVLVLGFCSYHHHQHHFIRSVVVKQ